MACTTDNAARVDNLMCVAASQTADLSACFNMPAHPTTARASSDMKGAAASPAEITAEAVAGPTPCTNGGSLHVTHLVLRTYARA